MWTIGLADHVLEALAAEAELEDVDSVSIASWQPSIASGAPKALEQGKEAEDDERAVF